MDFESSAFDQETPVKAFSVCGFKNGTIKDILLQLSKKCVVSVRRLPKHEIDFWTTRRPSATVTSGDGGLHNACTDSSKNFIEPGNVINEAQSVAHTNIMKPSGQNTVVTESENYLISKKNSKRSVPTVKTNSDGNVSGSKKSRPPIKRARKKKDNSSNDSPVKHFLKISSDLNKIMDNINKELQWKTHRKRKINNSNTSSNSKKSCLEPVIHNSESYVSKPADSNVVLVVDSSSLSSVDSSSAQSNDSLPSDLLTSEQLSLPGVVLNPADSLSNIQNYNSNILKSNSDNHVEKSTCSLENVSVTGVGNPSNTLTSSQQKLNPEYDKASADLLMLIKWHFGSSVMKNITKLSDIFLTVLRLLSEHSAFTLSLSKNVIISDEERTQLLAVIENVLRSNLLYQSTPFTKIFDSIIQSFGINLRWELVMILYCKIICNVINNLKGTSTQYFSLGKGIIGMMLKKCGYVNGILQNLFSLKDEEFFNLVVLTCKAIKEHDPKSTPSASELRSCFNSIPVMNDQNIYLKGPFPGGSNSDNKLPGSADVNINIQLRHSLVNGSSSICCSPNCGITSCSDNLCSENASYCANNNQPLNLYPYNESAPRYKPPQNIHDNNNVPASNQHPAKVSSLHNPTNQTYPPHHQSIDFAQSDQAIPLPVLKSNFNISSSTPNFIEIRKKYSNGNETSQKLGDVNVLQSVPVCELPNCIPNIDENKSQDQCSVVLQSNVSNVPAKRIIGSVPSTSIQDSINKNNTSNEKQLSNPISNNQKRKTKSNSGTKKRGGRLANLKQMLQVQNFSLTQKSTTPTAEAKKFANQEKQSLLNNSTNVAQDWLNYNQQLKSREAVHSNNPVRQVANNSLIHTSASATKGSQGIVSQPDQLLGSNSMNEIQRLDTLNSDQMRINSEAFQLHNPVHQGTNNSMTPTSTSASENSQRIVNKKLQFHTVLQQDNNGFGSSRNFDMLHLSNSKFIGVRRNVQNWSAQINKRRISNEKQVSNICPCESNVGDQLSSHNNKCSCKYSKTNTNVSENDVGSPSGLKLLSSICDSLSYSSSILVNGFVDRNDPTIVTPLSPTLVLKDDLKNQKTNSSKIGKIKIRDPKTLNENFREINSLQSNVKDNFKRILPLESPTDLLTKESENNLSKPTGSNEQNIDLTSATNHFTVNNVATYSIGRLIDKTVNETVIKSSVNSETRNPVDSSSSSVSDVNSRMGVIINNRLENENRRHDLATITPVLQCGTQLGSCLRNDNNTLNQTRMSNCTPISGNSSVASTAVTLSTGSVQSTVVKNLSAIAHEHYTIVREASLEEIVIGKPDSIQPYSSNARPIDNTSTLRKEARTALSDNSSDIKCAVSDCENAATVVCGGCQNVTYCSGECQKKHWYQEHLMTCNLRLTNDVMEKGKKL